MNRLKTPLRWLFGWLLIAAGVNHFVDPDFYAGIMPPWLLLDWHLELVWLSGVAELVVGTAVCIRRLAPHSGWAACLLLLAVFPANVHMALHPELFSEISPILLWVRLPLQALLVIWALWATSARRETPHSEAGS